MTTCAAVIVGIDGWEEYTLPLIQSIREHEPLCNITVIDNASDAPYIAPSSRTKHIEFIRNTDHIHFEVIRTERLCYSGAINLGASRFVFDWLVILSNDVLCTGPFLHMLEAQGDGVIGPKLLTNHGWTYIEGWCVCVNRHTWDTIGGWDEQFIMSSWEDVSFSVTANERGLPLIPYPELPFVHLDQRQRFALPGYGGSEAHNYAHFLSKHLREVVTA